MLYADGMLSRFYKFGGEYVDNLELYQWEYYLEEMKKDMKEHPSDFNL